MIPSYSIYRNIYYDDTDSGGVVYHANYLRYMEHARSDFLQTRGFGPQILVDEYKVLFVVTDVAIKYIAPAKLGNEIEIIATLDEHTSVKVQFGHEVWLLDADRERKKILSRATATVVCLDTQNFKPMKIPHTIQEKIIREC